MCACFSSSSFLVVMVCLCVCVCVCACVSVCVCMCVCLQFMCQYGPAEDSQVWAVLTFVPVITHNNVSDSNTSHTCHH